MPNSNFPGGFPFGVTVRGLSLLNTYPGKVFWVDSNGGSNQNKGTFDRPFDTIDYAVGRCTADNGDIIMVKAGHVETVTAAAGLDLDVAGISIIGLGNGTNRPQINFTTAVGADMDVDAANITVANLRFTGGIDALTGPIDINAANFSMFGCVTQDVTGQAVDWIVADGGADYLRISDWTHYGDVSVGGSGADTAFTIAGADYWVIENFDIHGNFTVAAIENTAASVSMRVGGGSRMNFCRNVLDAASPVIVTLHASTTGMVGPNIYVRLGIDATSNGNNITEAFVGAAADFFQPLAITNAGGETALNSNITAVADN